ncbi:MAG: hypothetical protein KBD66_02445, partial [Candidatus Doudnabacteria bacterium]|nr:hypothetical protein [Candidatus Doudnabacteria bacterium]
MRKIVPPEFLNLINRKEGHSKLYEDRRMITDRSPWPVYDEGAMDFFHTFQSLLEGGRGLGEYLRLKLPSEVIGRAVGIELGGPGVQLFSDLQGIFAKTAGVDLSGKEYFTGAHHI